MLELYSLVWMHGDRQKGVNLNKIEAGWTLIMCLGVLVLYRIVLPFKEDCTPL